MNATNVAPEFRASVDELAACWTDSALALLKASDVKGPSVPMELASWQVLKEVLHSALPWRRWLRISPASASAFMAWVLLKTTLRVARQFEPGADAFTLVNRIRPWIHHIMTAEYPPRPDARESRHARISGHARELAGALA